jgi:hypothetical protein
MNKFFIAAVLLLVVGLTHAIQPVRKPFIQLTVDGKQVSVGEILVVKPGQKMILDSEFMGGRRDFCKFPDIYADIAGSAQILSRGNDGISYQVNGTISKWKLSDEKINYTADENVTISSGAKASSVELTFSNSSFSQSFLKVNIKAEWVFTEADKTSKEVNTAETIIYFKVAGSSDTWYSSHDVLASGMNNDQVLSKLKEIQEECDSIENNINKLRFSTVQHSIKTLRAHIDSLKLTIDQVKASNPVYQVKIAFIGLPTDNPFLNLGKLNLVKSNWNTLSPLMQEIKSQLDALPEKPTPESHKILLKLIADYSEWLTKLPENTPELLSLYFQELNKDGVWLSESIQKINDQKNITNYAETLSEFNSFISKRAEQLPDEILLINSVTTKLQAVKLFDSMLRSFYSSISWAEWKNTRDDGL